MLHPAQSLSFTGRCSPLASSVTLPFPAVYQPHPGGEMKEQTTSRAICRTCTSCHLSAQSLLTAGIPALLSGGPERSTACKCHNIRMFASEHGKATRDVCILSQSGSRRVQPHRAPRGGMGRGNAALQMLRGDTVASASCSFPWVIS